MLNRGLKYLILKSSGRFSWKENVANTCIAFELIQQLLCYWTSSVARSILFSRNLAIIRNNTWNNNIKFQPEKKAVLVLGNKQLNKPIIIDFDGRSLSFSSNIDFNCLGYTNAHLNFEYGDGTNADNGCGATLHNVFWYFGVRQNKRQVKLQKHLLNINLLHLRPVKL